MLYRLSKSKYATAMCATRANLAGKYLRLTLKQNNLERKVLNARAKKVIAGSVKHLRCEQKKIELVAQKIIIKRNKTSC